MRSRHLHEDHDHEARQGRTLQNLLPVPFEITHDPISDLVLSLPSKRRIGKARLEAAHWVMRTSFAPQSLLCQFPVSQILVPQLYTTLPCCNHPDHDASFQRDPCDPSVCKGSDKHQRLFSHLVVLVSVARDSVAVFGTLLAASHPP